MWLRRGELAVFYDGVRIYLCGLLRLDLLVLRAFEALRDCFDDLRRCCAVAGRSHVAG